LDSEIENKFEDDYNYKNINIQDKPEFELEKVLEDCFDFIDDGRHYGNVLIHCSGTIGLSRSTAVCIAYLMNKEKQKFDEAFNNVKEARSFVKPNEGFTKQLKEYEVKLRGAQEAKDSGIDDPFAMRKKQEIEKEKAMVAGAASVKNRMKMFGSTLDTGATSRSKSVSPMPEKANQSAGSPSPAGRKWGSNRDAVDDGSASKTISKSMTPEPRKSWQTPVEKQEHKPDWRSPSTKSTAPLPSGPPPPPPPMPKNVLHGEEPKYSSSSVKSSLPPPPPPQPQPGALLKDKPIPTKSSVSSERKSSDARLDQADDESKQRMVFGRVPPPAMKIKGGLSIERQDSISEKNMGLTKANTQ